MHFNPLDINPGLMIWTFIIFGTLLFLLGKLAWKPLLGSLKAREEAISDSLNKAEMARSDAERIIAENKLERIKAEQEVQKALKEGREYAEKMRQDLMAKANEEAQHLLAQAREEIQRDAKSAILQLRNEAAELAIMATGKLLDENMNDDRQRRLVQKMIAELPTAV